MNLESNTTAKINNQHLKSKYNNPHTLTNNNYIVISLQYIHTIATVRDCVLG